MSVELTGKNGQAEAGLSNGHFAAAIAMARAFGEDVPAWNGYHDGQFYTAEHLIRIANRAKQMGEYAYVFEDLASDGGATIS